MDNRPGIEHYWNLLVEVAQIAGCSAFGAEVVNEARRVELEWTGSRERTEQVVRDMCGQEQMEVDHE